MSRQVHTPGPRLGKGAAAVGVSCAHRIAAAAADRVHTSAGIGMSSTNTYIVPLAMLALALMLIAAALWL
jgi:hypothetical protein